MIFQLLKYKWLQFWRSPTFSQSMVQNVILGLVGVYFLLNFLVLGFLMPEIVQKIQPEGNLLTLVGTGFFYYALMDLLMRYFVQKFPVIDLKPYLTLPITKNTLAHNLLLRSIGSFYNLLPLCFLLPFFFRNVVGNYPITQVLSFALLGIGIVLFNNFLVFYIDKRMALKGNWIGGILVGIIILFFCEYKGYIQLFPFLQNLAERMLSNPLLSAIPLLLAGGLYFISHRLFTDSFTLDTPQTSKQLFAAAVPTGLFDRFGKAGILMDLEMKLMLRSKRARAYLMMSVFFLLYPFLFLDTLMDSTYLLLFVCLVLTGMIAMNHGQLMLSWNSLHFDLLQSRTYTYYDLFSAKYYLLAISCVLTFVISLPYVLLSSEFMVFNFVIMLFNMTVSLFAYMLLASYNSLRIDPNEGSAFNLSGFGAAHYLIIFPIMAMPCLLYWIGSLIGGKAGGLFLIGLIGVLGLLFHRQIIQLCVNNFKENRYKIGAAFRKSQ